METAKDFYVKEGTLNDDMMRRMNGVLNSSVMAYCEVNLSTLRSKAIHFTNAGQILEGSYAQHLQLVCGEFVHTKDHQLLLKKIGVEALRARCASNNGKMQYSVRYRGLSRKKRPMIMESKVYILKEEEPHYACIITTEVTQEEAHKMQLMLYSEVTQDVLNVFQFNLTENWCGNGAGQASVNPSRYAMMKKCKTVDDFCRVVLENIVESPEKEKARIFFSRENMIKTFEEGKKTCVCTFPYALEDGYYTWVRVKLNMVENALTGNIEGIICAENKEEDVIKDSLIGQIINNDYDYIILIDLRHNTAKTITNENMYKSVETEDARSYMEEYLRRSYVGEDMEEFIQKNSIPYILDMLSDQEKYEFYYYNREKNGEIRYKKGTYSHPKGDRRYVVFSRADYTQAIAEQKRVNDQLSQALAESAKATRAKTEIFSRMSHDIRTPLNTILGLTALTLDEVDRPKVVAENLEKISSAGNFLLALVNDILDMTKIEEGAVELHYTSYAYTDFISNMRTMFEPVCKKNRVHIEFSEPNIPLTVLTDKVRLNQIFFNILSNAVKYTPEGGRISYNTKNIVVENGYVSCDYIIKDTGIGISKEFQKTMFQPFTQEDTSVSALLQGTGLGLSITKSLVDMMGGTIAIESEPGKGTTVTVHLSLQVLEKQEHDEVSKATVDTDWNTLAGTHVLLVEDHPLNAEIAQKLLEKKQMVVYHAPNGQEALQKFEASKVGFFDVILMDIRMPVMNGLEAARAIRSLKRKDASTVPILAMTANAYQEDVDKSLQAGMNGHMAKPIDAQKLYESIAELKGEFYFKNR